MTVKSYLLGPGTLKIGETGTAVDYSAQVTACKIAWDKDAEDAVPVLSGEELPGDITWSATLSATFIQDLSDTGLVDYTWQNKGNQVPVEFVPSTSQGKAVTGVIEVTPLDIGGDVKKRNTSDIEWSFIGEPTLAAVV